MLHSMVLHYAILEVYSALIYLSCMLISYNHINILHTHLHNVNTHVTTMQGINLSGGQRQRVSIARAAYADADVYLLDSPVSAVDTTVASHIFDKCFKQLLAGKTRILCTNQLQFLPQCDRVLVLKCDGVRSYISKQGTYNDLIAQDNSELAQLMSSYSITTELCTTISSNDRPDNSDNSSSTSSENDTDTTDTTAAVDTAAVLPDSLVRFTEELQLHATLSRSHSSLREPSLLLMSAHSAHSSALLYDDYNEDNTTATNTAGSANTAATVSTTAAASSSGNAVAAAGTRLVQDETIAAGRVQWQVYTTYFNEGSGGTLLTDTLMTVSLSTDTTAHFAS
jgi:energy-coupling factor transporter ATP-binding protein EcfA2